jgi:chromosome partitioning protein
VNQALTITILNQKGGVGKSTVAVNIGAELSKLYKTIIIDCDGQGSCEDFSNARNKVLADLNDLTVCKKTFRNGPELNGREIRQAIKTFKDDYEIVILDSPGNRDNVVLGKALASVANLVIIPVTPGYFDSYSTDSSLVDIDEVMAVNELIEARVLLNRRDGRTNLTKEMSDFIKKGKLLPMKSTLGNRTIYGYSGAGLSVVEMDHRSEAAAEVNALVEEIEIILGLRQEKENEQE